MNNFDYTIIETAIIDISKSNSAYKSRIAKFILDEMSTDMYKDDATSNPLNAIYKATMRNARFNQYEEAKWENLDMKFKPAIYDIAFYSFIQTIMDKVCWAARRGTVARISVDQMEEEMLGGNGIDFAMDVNDEIGIDGSSASTIREDVLEMHRVLSNVSVALSKKCGIGGEPLYLFAPTSLVDDEWVQVIQTFDWDEALSHMNQTVEELRKLDKIETNDIEEAIDFAA